MKRIAIEQALNMKFPEWIAMIVTRNPETGPANIMPVGWMMCCSFEPPMIAVAIGNTRYTHELLLKNPKFVLAFAGEGQAELVKRCGASSGRNVDKFKELAISHVTGDITGCPLLLEAAFNLECEVADHMLSGDHTIFSASILAAHAPEQPVRKIENFGAGYYCPARPG